MAGKRIGGGPNKIVYANLNKELKNYFGIDGYTIAPESDDTEKWLIDVEGQKYNVFNSGNVQKYKEKTKCPICNGSGRCTAHDDIRIRGTYNLNDLSGPVSIQVGPDAWTTFDEYMVLECTNCLVSVTISNFIERK